MAEPVAIRAEQVSKKFVVHSARATSMKERLVRRGASGDRWFDALHDVTLDIHTGHTVGLIGPNGSGKSTLLKVLAGILRPSSGTVSANGRIASLLELGAGFNGELSGRDNVYLNSSLLGLSRRETDRLFDSIVDFSELGDFIDNPVKHYSSGMYVRLGFSVAVHVDPDILLVDEVLAVGDEAFSRKCLGKIAEFQAEGRTILFVSHALDLIERMCSRGIVLNAGKVVYDGDPEFATGALRKILGTDEPEDGPLVPAVPEEGGLTFDELVVSGTPGGPAVDSFKADEPLNVRLTVGITQQRWVENIRGVQAVVMGVGDIPVFLMETPPEVRPTGQGAWTVDFALDTPALLGRFVVGVQLVGADGNALAHTRTPHPFAIAGGQRAGLLKVPYEVRAATG